jgi:hypothetical protein
MMRWFLLLLLISHAVLADVSLGVGAGQGVFEAPGTPFERVASLGYQIPVGDFFIRPEAIYFAGVGPSSFLFTTKIGVRTLVGGFEAHLAIGPSYLSNPDPVYLGGHLQFSPEVGVCSNDRINALCFALDHESSGGIYDGNQGRNFWMFYWRIL